MILSLPFRHPPVKASTTLQAAGSKAYSDISTSTQATTVEIEKRLNAFKHKGCRGVEKKSAHQPQKMPAGVAAACARLYRLPVAANSATRVWRPGNEIDAQASHPKADAFFVSATSSYGGCVWETFGSAGFQFPRFANLRTAATHNRLATIRGSSKNEIGAVSMQFFHAQNPRLIPGKAAAHRAMAMAALRAESSLSVRLRRYNDHMKKARRLEQEGAFK